MEELTTGLQAGGGGISGAIAYLLVFFGAGISIFLWKAYQKKLEEDKEEDKKEKEHLRQDLNELRKEGRERESKLITLVENGQRIQSETNDLIREFGIDQRHMKSEQTQMKSDISYLKGAFEAKVGKTEAKQ